MVEDIHNIATRHFLHTVPDLLRRLLQGETVDINLGGNDKVPVNGGYTMRFAPHRAVA